MGHGVRGRRVGPGVAAGAAAIVGSYLAVRSGRLAPVDDRLAAMASRPLGSAADRVISTATDLGSVYSVAGVSGALWFSGRRRVAVDVAASGLLAWGVAQGIKPLLPRHRPYEADGATRLVAIPAGSSWPSGHAAVMAAMVTALVPTVPPASRAGLRAAAAAVGASRLYVGVHHPTDLVAGYGVGALSGAVWQLLRRRISSTSKAELRTP